MMRAPLPNRGAHKFVIEIHDKFVDSTLPASPLIRFVLCRTERFGRMWSGGSTPLHRRPGSSIQRCLPPFARSDAFFLLVRQHLFSSSTQTQEIHMKALIYCAVFGLIFGVLFAQGGQAAGEAIVRFGIPLIILLAICGVIKLFKAGANAVKKKEEE